MTQAHFTLRSRTLHMLGAFLVMLLLAVGLSFEIIHGPAKLWAVSLHKLIGFMTLWVALWWLLEVIRQPKPDPVKGFSRVLHIVSIVVKTVILLGAIIMPLSGWLSGAAGGHTAIKALGFNLPNPFTVPNKPLAHLLWETHETYATILLYAIGLHIVGALYHHVIRKDTVLHRMFPFISVRK
jgi:cytochrome b561